MADLTSARLTWEPRALSILRLVTGLLYVEHGLNKFFNFPPGAQPRAYDLFTLVPGLAGILETFGGILLIFGLFTRPVAFVLAGEMAVAYFMAHAPRGLYPYSNGGTLAVLYCFVFLYLFVAGGGEWVSTDSCGGAEDPPPVRPFGAQPDGGAQNSRRVRNTRAA